MKVSNSIKPLPPLPKTSKNMPLKADENKDNLQQKISIKTNPDSGIPNSQKLSRKNSNNKIQSFKTESNAMPIKNGPTRITSFKAAPVVEHKQLSLANQFTSERRKSSINVINTPVTPKSPNHPKTPNKIGTTKTIQKTESKSQILSTRRTPQPSIEQPVEKPEENKTKTEMDYPTKISLDSIPERTPNDVSREVLKKTSSTQMRENSQNRFYVSADNSCLKINQMFEGSWKEDTGKSLTLFDKRGLNENTSVEDRPKSNIMIRDFMDNLEKISVNVRNSVDRNRSKQRKDKRKEVLLDLQHKNRKLNAKTVQIGLMMLRVFVNRIYRLRKRTGIRKLLNSK